MTDPVLTLDGVTHTYGAQLTVLSDIDMSLSSGTATALVGQSGAGKSTLLHIAGLLEVPTAGNVTLQGQDAGNLSDKKRTALRREKIGFVYQFHHLLPEFSALENVVLPQLINGETPSAAEHRAKDLLAKVGLSDRLSHRPSQLSGGEQQRVAIARALANRPALLLADEPTGNLDTNTAETVFALLMDLVRAEGMSMLMATHNTDLAQRLDQTLRIENGTIATQ